MQKKTKNPMNIAMIFAGGVGMRMGMDLPKQFLEWDGKAIIVQTIEVFEDCPEIDEIIIACKDEWIDHTLELIKKAGLKKVKSVVPGGETALKSQLNGLQEIERRHVDVDVIVLIHDAVRPLVDNDTVVRCIKSVQEHGNAITVTPAIETVVTVGNDGIIESILDRDLCRMAKAPQCFYLKDILRVHRQAIADNNHTFVDSSSMMIAYGCKLNTVFGRPENIKVTTPVDYHTYLGIVSNKEANQ